MDNQNSFVAAAWNFMLHLNAGDVIHLVFYTNDSGIKILADQTLIPTEPNIPSIILTVHQLAYAGPTGPTGPKTFVIDHPIDEDKYLVHACLEGPEAGVYYRGISEITNGSNTTIELPNYVYKLANDFTIHLTPIYDNKFVQLAYTEITDNKFTVFSNNGNVKFSWQVYGKRQSINVEPFKKDVILKGEGPYTWL